MAEINPIKRSFNNPKDESGLSPRLPLPNIIRIEALNRIARERYLGGIQKEAGRIFRDPISTALGKRKLDKFYGFMKGTASKVLELGSTWRQSGNNGGNVGFVRNLISGGGSAGIPVFDDILGVARDLTGISASGTGATTLKRFESSTLQGFTINCGWYLPEQYGLCIKSLKSILTMSYPIQVDSLTPRQILAAVTQIGKAATEAGGEKVAALANVFGITSGGTSDAEKQEKTESEEEKAAAEEKKRVANTTAPSDRDERIKEDSKTANDDLMNTNLTKISDFFGRNLTFDPVPVRCSIGHYIDIEPLIINKLGIEFSDNTFINSDGRHLPIFCSVSITFDFWLTPAPKLQFLSLLGNEMFGDNEV